MDPAYITPFIRSVQNVFATMLQLQVEIGTPYVKTQPAPSFDVTGVIGMTGEVTGSVSLSMPKATAQRLVTLLTGGAAPSAESPDFADAIGELINMISGGAKAQFPGKRSSISCPTVVIGEGHTVSAMKEIPCVAIPCSTDCGEFSLDIMIRPAGTPAASAAAAAAGTAR